MPEVKACLTAVGPFASSVMPHLEHPAKAYENVKSGAWVVSRLFKCTDTLQAARMRRALGLDGTVSPSQEIDPRKLDDPDWLEETFHFDGGFADFLALRQRGFLFFYTVDREL